MQHQIDRTQNYSTHKRTLFLEFATHTLLMNLIACTLYLPFDAIGKIEII